MINLVVLSAALFGLVVAFPEHLRWALVPVFLFLPLSVVEYRSPDTVAIHGALAALAVASAVLVARAGPIGTAALVGATLFALGKVRSVYGLYALVGLALAALAVALLTRRRAALTRAAVAVAVWAALELMWVPVLRARANDPRVADRGAITSHDVFAMLISGVGWSPNRWGIEAPDPRVVMFISRRLALPELPRLDTKEGEVHARRAYLSLWREDPLHLVWLYVRRAGAGIGEHMALGGWGAPVWLGGVATAAVLAWRRRDTETLAAVVAGAALTACLLAQVALVDPRIIYAYPLRFVSALTLATAAVALVRDIARARAGADDAAQGAANSSRG